jgi:hypothetical protein
MQLGAPPELLLETHRAAADEIEHARICFGLAERYGAGAVGPGPLELDGCLEDSQDLEAILHGLMEEACIGETLAAIELLHAASTAEDPALRRALQGIADDELRHAQLGWRCLTWILHERAPELRALATRTFAGTLQRMRAEFELRLHTEPSEDDAGVDLSSHGILPSERRARLRLEAIETVLTPCSEALLGAPEGLFQSAPVTMQA